MVCCAERFTNVSFQEENKLWRMFLFRDGTSCERRFTPPLQEFHPWQLSSSASSSHPGFGGKLVQSRNQGRARIYPLSGVELRFPEWSWTQGNGLNGHPSAWVSASFWTMSDPWGLKRVRRGVTSTFMNTIISHTCSHEPQSQSPTGRSWKETNQPLHHPGFQRKNLKQNIRKCTVCPKV